MRHSSDTSNFSTSLRGLLTTMAVGIFVSLSLVPSGRAAETPIDISVDLDNTLLYGIGANQYHPDDPDHLEYNGHYYRFTDGTREFLSALVAIPEVRVSIYTGGPADRTEAILKKIQLAGGRSAFESVFKMLSFDDLVKMPNQSSEARFKDKYKKDLHRVSGSDLSQSILVDDMADLIYPGQESHVLFLQRTFIYVDEQDHDQQTTHPYHPPDPESGALERNKLAWALGMINAGVARMRASPGAAGFSQWVDAHQKSTTEPVDIKSYDAQAPRINRELEAQRHFYEDGLALMKKIKPDLRFIPFTTSCQILFR
jgi:hypothetical protein